MADETPDNDNNNNNNNEKDLFAALGADMDQAAQQESWIMLNEVYRGLVSGGFTQTEAIAVLTNLMWKMMLEGDKG